jgi:DNA-binding LacI/PurR family transcriptional regulator
MQYFLTILCLFAYISFLNLCVYAIYGIIMSTASSIYNSKATRVADQLTEDVRLGKFGSGILLPTDATLARQYQVTRDTMRKSLALFSQKQEMVKLPQGGCFIEQEKIPDGNKTSRQNLSIGVVWATVPSGHQMEICKGIERYAQENPDLHLNIFVPSQGHQELIHQLTHLERSAWDGIIVYPYADEQYSATIRNLVALNFPVVCVDRRIDDVPVSSVEVYNTSGMFQATAYLIEKYQRPAYLLCGKREHSAQIDRYHGYRQAMDDAGYDHVIEEYTFESTISENDPQYWPVAKKWWPGFLLAEQFLEKMTGPASVVCTHDYIARGLYEAAARRGRTIGKDLAVVSFDDMPMARLMKPMLTTVHQPRNQVGYESARLLHRLIQGRETSPQHIFLPVELIIRDSA